MVSLGFVYLFCTVPSDLVIGFMKRQYLHLYQRGLLNLGVQSIRRPRAPTLH